MRAEDLKLRVLILEDNKADAELTKLQLEGFNCAFRDTHKKKEYLALLKDFRPDIILADFNLPGFNGLEALALLREQDGDTPFIFVTGTLGEETAVASIKAGATDFVVKNRMDNLPAAVMKALREARERERRKQEEHRFKALIENSHNCILITDEKTAITYVSPAVSTTLGFNAGELIGSTLADLINDSEKKAVEEEIQALLNGKQDLVARELRLKQKSKQYRWVSAMISDQRKVDRVNGLVINFQDMDEKKKAELALKKSERKFRRLTEGLNTPVCIIQGEKLVFVNDETLELTGYSGEEMKSTFFNELIHPEDREVIVCNIQDHFENNTNYHNTDIRVIKKNKDVLYLNIRTTLIQYEGIPSILCSAADITTLKNELYEKAKLSEQLAKQNQELENFVYIISHNIRAPIAGLLGLVECFDLETVENGTNRMLIDRVKQVTIRLDQTIMDLNDSLQLKEVSKSSYSRVRLDKVVEDIKELLSSQIQQCGADIKTDFNDTSEVVAVKSYVTNIMYNLIHNAIVFRAIDRKPRISIKTRKVDNEMLEVKVKDNGVGMDLSDPKKKNKVFGMYGRLTTQTGGKGLGLYLLKVQVEAMGGNVDVESKINKGTAFTVQLKLNQNLDTEPEKV